MIYGYIRVSTSKMGIIVLSLMASFAEPERKNTRERVTAGIQASLSRGERIGRRKTLSPDGQNEVNHIRLVLPFQNSPDDTESHTRQFREP